MDGTRLTDTRIGSKILMTVVAESATAVTSARPHGRAHRQPTWKKPLLWVRCLTRQKIARSALSVARSAFSVARSALPRLHPAVAHSLREKNMTEEEAAEEVIVNDLMYSLPVGREGQE